MQKLPIEKEDKRIRRSKRDLSNALDELLDSKNFDDISIQDIVDKAMVSKNTFYNNFLDKNELLMYLFKRYSLEVYEKIEPLFDEEEDLDKISKESLKYVIEYLSSNYKKFKKMIDNDRSKALYWNFYKFIQEIVAFVFSSFKDKLPFDTPLEIISPFLAGGISSLIYSMYEGEKIYSREEIYSYLEKLTQYGILKNKINLSCK